METLPPPDGQLVLRYYYEEEKLKDIARDLGLSVLLFVQGLTSSGASGTGSISIYEGNGKRSRDFPGR